MHDPTCHSFLRLQDDLVTGCNVVTVKLLVGVFHLFGPGQVSVVLIDVIQAHLTRWVAEQLLETGFEISHVSTMNQRL